MFYGSESKSLSASGRTVADRVKYMILDFTIFINYREQIIRLLANMIMKFAAMEPQFQVMYSTAAVPINMKG